MDLSPAREQQAREEGEEREAAACMGAGLGEGWGSSAADTTEPLLTREV